MMHTTLIPVVDWVFLFALFALGLLFGSFLNVVGYRVPRGESIVLPGSHCPHCKRALSSFELLPVLSWIWLGGKCRTCRHSISLRYPVIELCTGCLFAATYTVLPLSSWPQLLGWCLFWLLLMATVATDLTSMRVPNVISIPGFMVALITSVATGIEDWSGAILGAVGCFLTLLVIHLLSRGNMGLGDVKLYLSIGAVLGWLGGVESLVVASFYGVLIGLVLRATGILKPRQHIPFVPYIAMGVITVMFFGKPLTHWYIHDLLGLT